MKFEKWNGCNRREAYFQIIEGLSIHFIIGYGVNGIYVSEFLNSQMKSSHGYKDFKEAEEYAVKRFNEIKTEIINKLNETTLEVE